MTSFFVGAVCGATIATVYYVYQAVQELKEIDAAETLAEIINFPYNHMDNNTDGDYE